jgi:hypothetical protein
MIHSKQVTKTVEANGHKFQIVRVKYWGWNCNSLSTRWEVHKNGEVIAHHTYLRDAKADFVELTSPLRERLCTPMTVGEASIAASTVR